MSGINICGTLGGNAGKPICDVRMGRIAYVLPTRGKVFSAADLLDATTFKAALKAAMLLERTSNDKVFIFPGVRVADDNTADVNTATLADGYEEVLNESLPAFNLQTTAGVCQAQAMTRFNGWTDGVYIVDDKKVFWYVTTSTGGAQSFSTANMYSNPPRFGNSGAIQVTNTRLLFGNIDEFKSGVGAIKLDFDISKLTNTVDVTLVEKAAVSTNVYTIGGNILCAGIDIYDAFSTGLANAARWVVTRLDTGAVVAITTVTASAGLKAWVITVDSTAHTALPSLTKLSINLAAPSVLDAAGVSGIEGVAIIYTKP